VISLSLTHEPFRRMFLLSRGVMERLGGCLAASPDQPTAVSCCRKAYACQRQGGGCCFLLASGSHPEIPAGCSNSACHPWFTAFVFASYLRELVTLQRQWCRV